MKFKRDVFFNYISLVIMAATGLLTNSVIALFYGSDELGMFNETYAWYMILSQISVWGIHMAIVKFVPETEDEMRRGSLLKSAFILVCLISLSIMLVVEVLLFCFLDFFWVEAMKIAIAGLTLISLNKLLLGYLNAINKMVIYAVFSSLRYIFFGGIVFVLSVVKAEPVLLAVVFPVSELIVFVLMLIYFCLFIKIQGKCTKKDFGNLYNFGTKILPSYMVLEMNTKVDVICLGFLLDDAGKIGVYSFAILFTEGFYSLYIVIRKIINPSLSEANVNNRIEDQIQEINNKIRKGLVLGGIIAFVGIVGGYYIVCILMNKAEYQIGVLYITIICGSIVFNGKSIIFGDLFAQIGLPLEESVLNIVTVTCNVVLNVILIVTFGTVGAAFATAISYCIFGIYMYNRLRVRTGITIK